VAVYERTYQRYEGRMTPAWSRFLVLPRFAFADLMQKKFFLIFLVFCFFWPLVSAVTIYVSHNTKLLENFGIPIAGLLKIDARFFKVFLIVQGYLAFFMTVLVGPGSMSRDLANNGMPLYLSRPFSRAEYILGRLSVLTILISAITWVPGLLLFIIQSSLAGSSWMFANLRLAFAVLVGSWLWIVVLSLLALSLSAWVRWRSVAAFMLLVVYFGGSFVAVMVNLFFRTDWGVLADLARSARRIWAGLLGMDPGAGPPLWAGWLSMALLAGFCLFLLSRKVRAYEVVR